MPLAEGSSDKTVSLNIKELLQAKYPKAQAIAISLAKSWQRPHQTKEEIRWQHAKEA